MVCCSCLLAEEPATGMGNRGGSQGRVRAGSRASAAACCSYRYSCWLFGASAAPAEPIPSYWELRPFYRDPESWHPNTLLSLRIAGCISQDCWSAAVQAAGRELSCSEEGLLTILKHATGLGCGQC